MLSGSPPRYNGGMIFPRHNRAITWFVICWILLFHYESLRANYLNPLLPPGPRVLAVPLGRWMLPKWPLLFPPAGWIMFYNVSKPYGFAEVYGLQRGRSVLIDPHAILQTRAVGYDNIHRNVLIGILSEGHAPAFCRYLRRKFTGYDGFVVVYAEYPDPVEQPERILRQVAYRCQ